MDQYHKFFEDVKAGRIVSAYALDGNGLAAAVSKMAFGNGMGVKIEHNLEPRDFFAAAFRKISWQKFRQIKWQSFTITYCDR